MDRTTRGEIISALTSRKITVSPTSVQEYLGSFLPVQLLSDVDLAKARKSISRFCGEFHDKFASSRNSFNIERVRKHHEAWWNGRLLLPESLFRVPNRSGGRPEKLFDDCTWRAKRLKTDNLMGKTGNELAFATARVMKKEHRPSAAVLILKSSTLSSKEVDLLNKKLEEPQVEKISSDKALALLVDGQMGKRDYKRVRKCTESAGAKVYPSYEEVQQAKKRCYPPKEEVLVSETGAQVNLQALVNHTASRILKIQEEVLQRLPEAKTFKMIYKCGMDGSSDHSEFKKVASADFSDSHIFLVTIVPIRLVAVLDGSEGQKEILIWNNSHPSSTRLTRPVKFVFRKETKDLVVTEFDYLISEINNLQPYVNGEWSVNHVVYPTMIDGKIVHILTNTRSSQVCNVCGLPPSNMNDRIAIDERAVNNEALKFGIPILHSKIRIFECIKNIGYRQDFQEYRVLEKSPNMLVFLARKALIQENFRKTLGLHVDKPRSGGVGNSNDGNTARTAFSNPELFAEITGVNKELIHRLAVLLEVLSSSLAINIPAFEAFCKETWNLYVQLYPWYWMPPSLHKILIHGSVLIQAAPVPIGCLSEEAQESRNKDLRRLRMNSTRKTSWVACHEDLMNALLVSSDPVISSLRDSPTKSNRSFTSEALKLLREPPL